MGDTHDPFALTKDQKRRKLRVGVAIDGSGVSEKALMLGGRLLHPDRRDNLYILHIGDPSKGWLPESLSPDHLEHEYQLKCHEHKVGTLQCHVLSFSHLQRACLAAGRCLVQEGQASGTKYL